MVTIFKDIALIFKHITDNQVLQLIENWSESEVKLNRT